ncbi:peptide-methionine (S)-S-oxide reductase MsrA [Micrococcus sp.]|uniref:peptide-methionine (S)-S-oxide reductase MsrA n=1 Tax=Micrococcus sp. TaxID=1271 RepID=UPI002A9167BF|nr:peptide-methionine (S)-S-oxide reductase MsrA [Micrococcus sp.]MDY6054325.1 peptide-methionine (S)-S-oxide reductase MsrA [Micrococcus sp.]
MAETDPTARVRPDAATDVRELTVAGGCFWCLDAVYRRVRGVLEVESGYTGGTTADPDYASVCSGTTGHAEAVRVRYDAAVVPTEVLLDLFFTGHDPTTLNRQGHDVGTQYRSALFARDEAEAAEFTEAIARAQQFWDRPIVTAVEPAAPWHPAEPEHQGFYERQPHAGYCRVIIDPKLAAVRRRHAHWLTQ